MVLLDMKRPITIDFQEKGATVNNDSYCQLIKKESPNYMTHTGSLDEWVKCFRVVWETLKMVLETSLLNTQDYKVRIKGKVEQSRERSCVFSYTSV